jgi:putative membrane protein insertion efficiency factor
MSPAAWALVAAIRAYKLAISPLLPPSCRFEPTCSRYAEEAVRRFGAVRGTRLAVGRISRCRPGVPGGYDPPPPT